MMVAYSQLDRLLLARKLTVPELHRRMRGRGWRINVKSLYRLSDAHEPLRRLDLRIAGGICEVCHVPLSKLVTFGKPRPRLRRLAASKQRRLESLMAKNNEGALRARESTELQALVREAEQITLENARALAGQRRRLVDR